MISTTDIRLEPWPEQSDATTAAIHDSKLVKRFVDGDSRAFDEIVLRYRGRTFTVAFKMLGSHADAEEIAQDVFIRAHRSLKNFRGDCSLATWLYRITANLSKNRYWYFFRRKKHDTISLDQQVGDDQGITVAGCIASETQSPSQTMVTGEFEMMISDSLRKLPWKHREILEMRIFEHRTYEYIADALCIDVGTVKSRISRARRSLLSIMASDYPELDGDSLAKILRENKINGVLKIA